MAWKKYACIGISAILALGAGLFTVEKQDVKVGTRGESARLNTLDKVGRALEELSPSMNVSMVYRDLIDFNDIRLQADYDEEKKEPTYKNAKVTVKTYLNDSDSMFQGEEFFETATYYISSEAVYAVFEGMYTFEEEDYKSHSFAVKYYSYRMERYVDEDYSLIRLSDALQLEEIDIHLEEGKKSVFDIYEFEMANIPIGLEKDVWYSIDELEVYGYSFSVPIRSEAINTSSVASFILENKEKFKYYDKNIAMNDIDGYNWWYVFGSNGVSIYTTEDAAACVYMNEEESPVIEYDYSHDGTGNNHFYWHTSIKLENVNATTLKKLEKPKIGKVDVNVKGEE